MNLSIRHLLLIAFFLISHNVTAQVEFVKNVSNKGTVAASFLEIGVNARAEAMGGAYTAERGNADMIYWNPAGLAFVDGVSTSFSNMEWLANTSFNFASVAVPLPSINSVLAGSFTTLGVPEQAVRADNGDLTGEFYDARDFAVNLSLATRLIESFSFGISTKYISQRIWSETAVGIGFDFWDPDRQAYWHHGWRQLHGVRCAGSNHDGHHHEHLRKRCWFFLWCEV